MISAIRVIILIELVVHANHSILSAKLPIAKMAHVFHAFLDSPLSLATVLLPQTPTALNLISKKKYALNVP